MSCSDKNCGNEECCNVSKDSVEADPKDAFPFPVEGSDNLEDDDDEDDYEIEGFDGTPLPYTEDEIKMPLHHALREFIQTLRDTTTVELDADTMELITISFMAGASKALYTSIHGINGTLDLSESVAADNESEVNDEDSLITLKKSFSVMELLTEANIVVYPEDEDEDEFEMKDGDERDTEDSAMNEDEDES